MEGIHHKCPIIFRLGQKMGTFLHILYRKCLNVEVKNNCKTMIKVSEWKVSSSSNSYITTANCYLVHTIIQTFQRNQVLESFPGLFSIAITKNFQVVLWSFTYEVQIHLEIMYFEILCLRKEMEGTLHHLRSKQSTFF